MPSSLGQELQRAREERGITLHQIADDTHIGVRFLQAIETDTYDILPGGIFNRAFVRKFAKSVGLDEEQALTMYDKQVEEMGGIEEPRMTYLRPEEFEEKSSNSGLLLSLVMLVLLAAGGYAAVQYFKGQRSQASNNNQLGVTTTPLAATPEATASHDATASPGASPDATASPAAATPTPNGLFLQLTAANGECWISVKPDLLGTQQYALKQGETKEVAADEKLVLYLGNYPALNIKINGKPVNPEKLVPNRTGVVVKNLVITKDNLQGFFD